MKASQEAPRERMPFTSCRHAALQPRLIGTTDRRNKKYAVSKQSVVAGYQEDEEEEGGGRRRRRRRRRRRSVRIRRK